MDLTAILNGALALMRRFPAGSYVWHRASGRRGIIDGWKICADGTTLLSVSWGDSGSVCYALELSTVPIPEGTEGEEWRLAENEDPGDSPTK